jgi:hypothetical protein
LFASLILSTYLFWFSLLYVYDFVFADGADDPAEACRRRRDIRQGKRPIRENPHQNSHKKSAPSASSGELLLLLVFCDI